MYNLKAYIVKFIFFLTVLFIVGCNAPSQKNAEEINSDAVTIVDGEQLFKTNCAACHKLNENTIGPVLKGVAMRWESKDLLYEFIRNSQELSTRNAYAKKLLQQYKQYPMMPFPNLKDKEIDAILRYCETN
jgi:mono/diheme cytochrome c family protein